MAFTTKKSLLAKVRAGDEVSWGEFYKTYKPLIILCGSDCGLNQDEIEDLIQLVMAEIFRKDILGKYDLEKVPNDVVFKYDPAKGRFRHYLRGIIRNQAFKLLKKRPNDLSLDDDENNLDPQQDVWNELWDDEWQKHLLNMAMIELRNKVQPETYAAFEMYAVQGRPVETVANFLNLSTSSVYTAKSRCITVLKEIIRTLEEK